MAFGRCKKRSEVKKKEKENEGRGVWATYSSGEDATFTG